MEAQLAEAMAMMQEHPELNTPENRQILHKLRYSIQGGGENDIQVTATNIDDTQDTKKTRVLSVTPNGELALDSKILIEFYVKDSDEGWLTIPKDNAFCLPSKFALLVLLSNANHGTTVIAWGPEDIEKLGMPDDEHLKTLISKGDIKEFKKIAASDEDLDPDKGRVGGALSRGAYPYVHMRMDDLRGEDEADFVRRVFGVKELPSPTFAL